MGPLQRWTRSRLGAAGVAVLLALSLAPPASASPKTLKRAVSNLLCGPLDFALGPIVGTRAVYHNIQEIEDTPGVRIAYVVPGVVWNSMIELSGGVLRTFTGALELIPGIILLPFKADMNPLFAPVEKANALIDEDFDFGTVKIGVDYVD